MADALDESKGLIFRVDLGNNFSTAVLFQPPSSVVKPDTPTLEVRLQAYQYVVGVGGGERVCDRQFSIEAYPWQSASFLKIFLAVGFCFEISNVFSTSLFFFFGCRRFVSEYVHTYVLVAVGVCLFFCVRLRGRRFFFVCLHDRRRRHRRRRLRFFFFFFSCIFLWPWSVFFFFKLLGVTVVFFFSVLYCISSSPLAYVKIADIGLGGRRHFFRNCIRLFSFTVP